MLKIYDKAQWHIDAGEDEDIVVAKLQVVFSFLDSKNFLGMEGKEIIDLGVDSSVSIHERMLTEEGNKFMEACYDKVIDKAPEEMAEALDQEYSALYSRQEVHKN